MQFGMCLTSTQVACGGWVGQAKGVPRRRRLSFSPQVLTVLSGAQEVAPPWLVGVKCHQPLNLAVAW